MLPLSRMKAATAGARRQIREHRWTGSRPSTWSSAAAPYRSTSCSAQRHALEMLQFEYVRHQIDASSLAHALGVAIRDCTDMMPFRFLSLYSQLHHPLAHSARNRLRPFPGFSDPNLWPPFSRHRLNASFGDAASSSTLYIQASLSHRRPHPGIRGDDLNSTSVPLSQRSLPLGRETVQPTLLLSRQPCAHQQRQSIPYHRSRPRFGEGGTPAAATRRAGPTTL